MHRQGYIVEEIADYSNMAESFDQVLRGSKRKKAARDVTCLRTGKRCFRNFTGKIKTGTFTVKDYRERKSWRVEKCDVSRYSP